MLEYIIKTPLLHDGETYLAGETVELDDKTAEQLLGVGAVEIAQVNPAQPPRQNANDAIAQVKAAATTEALDFLAEGEERKSVVAAILARRKELAPEGAE